VSFLKGLFLAAGLAAAAPSAFASSLPFTACAWPVSGKFTGLPKSVHRDK
jgi:hypothetical protein